jgi:ribosomal protein S12 methylthiotransferase
MDTVAIITLGCPKNAVDSERMMGHLEANGYNVVEDAEGADVVIVNTCGFIRPAKEESIDAILEAARLKAEGHCKALVVAGCLAQRYPRELERRLPEVDAVIGLKDVPRIVKCCDRLLGKKRTVVHAERRRLSTPAHYAYLRIADGCSNHCSYCAIPAIRGAHKSEPLEAVVAEARDLVERGVKELILIAQDTTQYGVDRCGASMLPELMTRLAGLDGLAWVRLMYTHPAHWSDALIEVMATHPNICRYADLPIQHISDDLLESMHRKATRAHIERLVEKLRTRIPGIALRTSVIVGLPGETDAHFRELTDFVEWARFERLGAFAYSQEEGTLAAAFPDQVSEEVKGQRLGQLMTLQQGVSEALNADLVGRTLRVLVDRSGDGEGLAFVGRTEQDAPEIDNEVLITEGAAEVGGFADVKITDAYEYDLVGAARSGCPDAHGASVIPAGP